MEFKPLENTLISLRKLEKEDFNSLFQVASDAEIWERPSRFYTLYI